jgi:hypothetical protein
MVERARHAALCGAQVAAHLLTFELSEEGDELTIYGDAAGLRILAGRISSLADKSQDQLSTSVWGGNELSLEPQGNGTRLVYQVRIVRI